MTYSNRMGTLHYCKQLYRLHKNKKFKLCICTFEKAFDQVPWNAVWWALRKLDVEEPLIVVAQLMYNIIYNITDL